MNSWPKVSRVTDGRSDWAGGGVRRFTKLGGVLCLLLLGSWASAVTTIYVKADANGAANGTTWTDAYPSLTDALTAATAGDLIMVAAGVYQPGPTRAATFALKDGVTVRGGYAGYETTADEPRPDVYHTILSGDIGTPGLRTDNCYHVVTADVTCSRTAILRGFQIVGGYADGAGDTGRGGGIFCAGEPMFIDCEIQDCHATEGGGAYCASAAWPILLRCSLDGNDATTGGGLYNAAATTTATACQFKDNFAVNNGGAVYNANETTMVFENCTFVRNEGLNGGAMANYDAAPSLYNCTLANNSSGYYADGTTPVGGKLRNCILYFDGVEINATVGYEPDTQYCDVQGGYAGTGNLDANPKFASLVSDNLRLQSDSPCRHAGVTEAGVPADDQDGRLRQNPPDVGAFECRIIFVDANAQNTESGISWDNAYRKLSTALGSASAGDEIWVADGIYYPQTTEPKTFVVQSDVQLYGGFAGGETTREQRDWTQNPTVLSSAGATPSYHVMTATGASSQTVLDGFTIQNGNANGTGDDLLGGGLFCDGGTPTIRNCTFANNNATLGGAVYCRAAAAPVFESVRFNTNNALTNGGALFATGSSSPALWDCTFTSNYANGAGGALYADGGALRVENGEFGANTATLYGGAVYHLAGAPRLVNCVFTTNVANGQGGAIANLSSNAQITNCTFAGNQGSPTMYQVDTCFPVVTNAIFWGNPGVAMGGPGTPTVVFSDVEGGWGGAGHDNINADPKFGGAADVRLRIGSPCINAGLAGGGVPPADKAGRPRSAVPDMGAYETRVVFVDQDATGLNDGSSWLNAFTQLQNALAVATSGDDLWVAEGVYVPTGGADRNASFNLKTGAAVLGSFVGTEDFDGARDPAAHLTVLSGNIGLPNDPTDNSYHVVKAVDVERVVLDGLTIREGRADGGGEADQGGGLHLSGSSLTVNNCMVTGNRAGVGGGLYAVRDASSFTRVQFTANQSSFGDGGAALLTQATARFTESEFRDNVSANQGGAVQVGDGSVATFATCTLADNSAAGWGGAVNLDAGCGGKFEACTFSGNQAQANGGAVAGTQASQLRMVNTTFEKNRATSGGAVYSSQGPATLTSVTFDRNSAAADGGALFNASGSVVITNGTFRGNAAEGQGGGILNDGTAGGSENMANSIFWGNAPEQVADVNGAASTISWSCIQDGWGGLGSDNIAVNPRFVDATNGDLRLMPTSPCIDAGDGGMAPLRDGVGNLRFDAPFVADTGTGTPTYTDLGALEYQGWNVIYVDASKTPPGDGTSWATAFTEVVAALTAAGPGDEIWVAQGTYYPGVVRSDSFMLRSEIPLYGGFNGDEVTRDARNWHTRQTILSGDVGTPGLAADNSYHVVTVGADTPQCTLDGFTITGGNADGVANDFGGGLLVGQNGEVTVQHCVLQENRASVAGGGAGVSQGTLRMTDCRVTDNSSGQMAAGVGSSAALLSMTNCVVNDNHCPSFGAGVYADSTIGADPATLVNCTISGNRSEAGPGGVFVDGAATTCDVINCIVYGNTAAELGTANGATLTVTYSGIAGGWAGAGNVAGDPVFNDPANGDFRLMAGSSCLDAADGDAAPELDLDGQGRFDAPVGDTGVGRPTFADIGAQEYNGWHPVFVDAAVVGGLNDGTSWANAYSTLTGALAAAKAGDELWVAAGLYRPGTLRADTFSLTPGVSLYGGFAGTETTRAGRLPGENLTILSGDVNGDDLTPATPGDPNRDENCFSVVYAGAPVGPDTVLDGFTITGGNANAGEGINEGAGLRILGSPLVRQCVLEGNTSQTSGAGFYVENGAPRFENCTIRNNYTDGKGGGGALLNASAIIEDGLFADNRAVTDGAGLYAAGGYLEVTGTTFQSQVATGEGGGAYVAGAQGRFARCKFSNNRGTNGAAVMLDATMGLPILSALFVNNEATGFGGGVHCKNGSSPAIVNCTFAGNLGGTPGVSLYCNSGSDVPNVTNTIMYGESWQAIAFGGGAGPTVRYSNIQGCGGSGAWQSPFGTDNGGNTDVNPRFADAAGGDLRLAPNSPCIDAADGDLAPGFDYNNRAPFDDLAVTDSGYGTPTFVDQGALEYDGWLILYVDRDSPGPTFDGSSWGNAFHTVSDALLAAVPGDEVWVAQGSYTPGAARADSLILRSGIPLFGGFSGSEVLRTERDPTLYETILNGDIGVLNDPSDNCYHVVTTGAVPGNALTVDGFTITNGNANGAGEDSQGGGMRLGGGSTTLRNCWFKRNAATDGGGLFVSQGQAQLSGCQFNDNQAGNSGGALYADQSSLVRAANSQFDRNSAVGDGGAIKNYNGSTVQAMSSTFTGNRSGNHGGAVANLAVGQFDGCRFSENQATSFGGALYYAAPGTGSAINCLVWFNQAGYGGGLASQDASPSLTNCTIARNTGVSGAGGLLNYGGLANPVVTNGVVAHNDPDEIANVSGGTVTVNYSCVLGGFAGTHIIAGDPWFVDATMGDFRLTAGSPAIDTGDATGAPATDLQGMARWDDPDVVDSGSGNPTYVDLGAYEYDGWRPLYVKWNAGGLNDGSSWADAYTDLQVALSSAGPQQELWVAAGTYTPGTLRTDTFLINGNAVKTYGGFAGTEATRDGRDWQTNLTVLSGDIDGGGTADCYHVVTFGAGQGAETVLDGFTITGGYADDPGQAPDRSGAGIRYTVPGAALIRNCRITGNYAQDVGAGMNLVAATPAVTNCVFANNTAGAAGAVNVMGVGSLPRFTNCVFSHNVASGTGPGAVQLDANSGAQFINCSFAANTGNGAGAVASLNTAIASLANCVFFGNTPSSLSWSAGGDNEVSYSNVEGCGGSGGGWDPSYGTDLGGNLDANPRFVDVATDDLRLWAGSPCVDAGDGAVAPSLDFLRHGRYDDGFITDTGAGEPTYADMGAYEWVPGAVAPKLDISGLTVPEDVGDAVVAVTMTGWSDLMVTVDCDSSDVTAAAGKDYTGFHQNLSWGPYTTGVSNANVSVTDDDVHEVAEDFRMTLSNAVNAVLGNALATVSITDNDAEPVLSIDDAWGVTEDAGTVTLTVSMDRPTYLPVSGQVDTADDTAFAGVNYTAITALVLNWPPEDNTPQPVVITILDDGMYDVTRSFTVNLSNVSNAGLLDGTGTVELVNVDPLPELAAADAAAAEDALGVTVTVSMTGLSGLPVSVQVDTMDGDAWTPNDYGAVVAQVLNWAPTDNTPKDVFISLVDDDIHEPTETFTVVLSNVNNASVTDWDATVAIGDNDPLPGLAVQDVLVNEAAGTVSVAVTMTGRNADPVSVDADTADDLAIAPKDYSAVVGQPLYWGAEDGSTKFVVIGVAEDDIHEVSETFTVNLSNVTNATITDASATVTIADNDPLPSLAVGDVLAQPEANTPAQVTITMTGRSADPVSVQVDTADGTAIAPKDYAAAVAQMVNWPAEDGTPKQVLIPLVDDDVHEVSETFAVNLSNVTNATITDATGIVEIEDDDLLPTLEVGDPIVNEAAGEVTVLVTITGRNADPVSVQVDTADDTAVAPKDYTAVVAQVLNWAPEDGSPKPVVIAIAEDDIHEATETFTVNLSNETNAVLVKPVGIVSIEDNDPVPTLAIGDAVVDEAVGSVTLTVTMVGRSGETVSVQVWTADVEAMAPKDYTAVGGDVLTWPAEDGTAKGLVIGIVDDDIHEPTETFTATLYNEINAVLADSEATVAIGDNDPLPGLAVADAAVDEALGIVSVAVTMTGRNADPVSVQVDTADGTASVLKDYNAIVAQVLNWGAEDGTPRDVWISIVDEDIHEAAETLTVNLSNETNAVLTDAAAVVSITDDDPVPTLEVQDLLALPEGVPQAEVVILMTGRSADPVSVQVDTADGTAIAPKDYAAVVAQMVNWPAEDGTPKQVLIPLVDDDVHEVSETFAVNLSNVTNATITDGAAIVEIDDNDLLPTLEVADAIVNEDAGEVTVLVTMTGRNADPVSVQVDTADDTAIAPKDYNAVVALVLNWGPEDGAPKPVVIGIVDENLHEATETFTVSLSNESNATVGIPVGIVSIEDNDPIPTLAIGDAVVNEGEGSVTLTVTMVGRSGDAVTVQVWTADDTAVGPKDYAVVGGDVLTWPAEDGTPKSLVIGVVDDDIHEATETFTASLYNEVNAALADDTATVTVGDNDPLPGLAVADAAVDEALGIVSVAVTMTGRNADPVSVQVDTADGTAIAPKDYNAIVAQVLNWGAEDGTPRDVWISIVDEDVHEATETFAVNLSNETNAVVTDGSGVVSVVDDDPVPTLEVQDLLALPEGMPQAEVVIVMTGRSADPVSVQVDTADGTAIAPKDYTAVVAQVVNWPAEDGTPKQVLIPLVDDDVHEVSETFTVNLSNEVNATLADASGIVEIDDNDLLPTLEVADAIVNEDAGEVTVLVTMTGRNADPVSVQVDTADGEAVAPKDYSAVVGLVLNWLPEDGTPKPVVIGIAEDDIHEATETFTVNLSNVSNAVLAIPVGIVSIEDNDPLPTLAIGDAVVDEAAGSVTLTVTMVGRSGEVVNVSVYTSDGTAITPKDYAQIGGDLVTWPAEDGTPKSLVIGIAEDDIHEVTETFTVDLYNDPNAELADGTATVEIVDNDPLPGLAVADAAVDEALGIVSVAVTMTGRNADPVSVQVDTADGTAIAPKDYSAIVAQVLNWVPEDGAPQYVWITIVDEDVHEATETLTVNLSNETNAVVTDGSGVVSVVDDDPVPTLAVQDVLMLPEGVPQAEVVIVMTGRSADPVSVQVDTADGTAIAPKDYAAVVAQVVNWPAEDGTPKQVLIPLVDDDVHEVSETFTVNLSNEVNATLADASGIVEIDDNDLLPTLEVADAIVNEDAGEVTVLVTMTGRNADPVSVQVDTADDTAVAPKDYSAVVGLVLNWLPEDGTPKPVVIGIAEDDVHEATETFTVNLSNETNALLVTPVGVVSIEDNDPLPTLAVADVVVDEAVGSVSAVVTMTGRSADPVSVQMDTADVEAMAPKDYSAVVAQVLNWAAEDGTPKSVAVGIVEDDIHEATETFTVTLSNEANATLSKAAATFTIADNDPLPTLAAQDAVVVEAAGTVNVTVTMTGRNTDPVFVQADTADGTAQAPKDYSAVVAQVLNWPAEDGNPKQVMVGIVDDDVHEASETFTANLSNVSNAVIAKALAVVEIDDNDPVPTLAAADMIVNEAVGSVTVTVTMTGRSADPVSVQADTADGTAIAPKDYSAIVAQVLNWAPEDGAPKPVVIGIVDDDVHEVSETFTVNLSNVSNATITKATATVQVDDNDALPALTIADAVVNEAAGEVTVLVTMAGRSADPVSVQVDTADGEAVAPQDHTAVVAQVLNWTAEDGSARPVVIGIVDDNVQEATETFSVNLSNVTNATVAKATGTVGIGDNDGAPTLSVADVSAGEETLGATVRVGLLGAHYLGVTVDYATADGTATAPADYTAAAGTLSWGPDQSGERTFNVPLVDDALAEGPQTVVVTLSAPVNAVFEPGKDQATLTITDNDTATLSLTLADASIVERGGVTTATVQHNVEGAPDVFVTLVSSDLTEATVPASITIPAGTYSAGCQVKAVNDLIVDGDQDVTVTATAATFPPAAAPLKILDDDTSNIIYVKADATGSNEGLNWANAFVDLQDALAIAEPGNEIWVGVGKYLPTATADRTAAFRLKPGVAVLGSFNTTETEPGQRDPLTNGWSVLSGDVGTPDVHTDNSYHVVVAEGVDSWTLLSLFVVENGNAAGDSLSGGGLLVKSVASGSPLIGGCRFLSNTADQVGGAVSVQAGAVEFESCQFSDNSAVTGGGALAVVGGVTLLRNSAFDVNTSANGGAVLVTGGAGLTVINATLAHNTATVAGGALVSSEAATVTMANSIVWGNLPQAGQVATATGGTVTATYSDVEGGLAGAGNMNADPWFVGGTGADRLQLWAGSPAIDAADGSLATPTDGRWSARFDDPGIANTGTGTPAYVDLGAFEWRPELAPKPVLSVADLEVSEAVGLAQVVVSLLGRSQQAVTASFATADGTALAGSDYTAVTGPVVFAPYTTGEKFVAIPVASDPIYELTETFGCALTNVSANAEAGTLNATVTILDDDTTPQVTITDLTVSEGVGTAQVVVTLVGGSYLGVTVDYQSANGTATAPTDYTAVSGTLTWAADAVGPQSIAVGIVDDDLDEPDISFSINLANAQHAGLAKTSGTVVIRDNDATPTVGALDVAVDEAVGTANVQVVLTGKSALTVSVDVATATGTATADSDYVANSQTLTWLAGITGAQTFDVVVLDDAVSQPNQTVAIALSNAKGAVISRQGTLTIVDNDGTPQLSIADATCREDGGVARLLVTMSGRSSTAVSVTYATADGTGQEGVDYLAATGTLNWAAGEAGAQEFTVEILDNATVDGDRTVNLRLANALGARIADGNAVLRIADDEILYVNASVVGGERDGSSWENAFVDLQEALDVAQPGQQVRVAAGVYRPSLSAVAGVGKAEGSRNVSFLLLADVGIYGGFAGGELTLAQRDWRRNPTILSGDLGVEGDASDNAYHVVAGVTGGLLDGFIIEGGNADGIGYPHTAGGGMINLDAAPTVANCVFQNNSAVAGGGMYNFGADATPTVQGCGFLDNTAIEGGAGMANDEWSAPQVTACAFTGNTAADGAGMICLTNAPLAVVNCTFSQNDATGQFGGGLAAFGPVTLANCSFSGNTAAEAGGAVYNADATALAMNCIFWGDSAPTGLEIQNAEGVFITATYSNIQGGYETPAEPPPAGGAAGKAGPDPTNIDADPLFVDAARDDLHLLAGSPCINAGTAAGAPVDDKDGRRRDADPDLGAYEYGGEQSVTLNLVYGWNLVAFPFTPSDTMPASLFGADARVVTLAKVAGTAPDRMDGIEYSYVAVTELAACVGYFVFVPAPEGLTVTVTGSSAPLTQLTLTPGWNMVGVKHMVNIGQAMKKDPYIRQALRYDAVGRAYQVLTGMLPADGTGYLIFAQRATAIAF